MITYQGLKYACIHCIRGHRSSTCDHRDRPLLQVRRRGRPIGDGMTRLAILSKNPCECIANGRRCLCDDAHQTCVVNTIDSSSVSSGKVSKKTLRLRTSGKPIISDEAQTDEEPIRAGKYVFVSVGGGLYRKQLASEFDAVERGTNAAMDPSSSCAVKSCCKPQPEASSSCCSKRAPQEPHSQLETQQSPEAFQEYAPHESHSAPFLIAPMSYNGHGVDDLGLTQDETDELWGAQRELDFAAMCVMPGQCQCDENCACENCYTHSRGRFHGNALL